MKFQLILTVGALILTNLPLIKAGNPFPRVRIFSPINGAIWFTGETRTIFWRIAYVPPPPVPLTLNITLRRVNDPSFRLPITRLYPTANLTLKWKIPAKLPNADDYYIRITPNRRLPGSPNMMSSKSKPFTIVSSTPSQASPHIKVLQPDAKSVWYTGQTRNLQWLLRNLNKPANVSLLAQDVTEGVVGKPYAYPIVQDLQVPAAASGSTVMSYRWMVPFEFRTSTGYQISVVVQFDDGSAPLVTVSDKFKIIQTGDAGRPTGTPVPIPPQ